MRILLVNDYIEKIAGTEIYIWSLKEELEKRGHIVEIFGSNKTKEEYTHSQNKSVSRYLNNLFHGGYYSSFKEKINEFKPDIIHIHGIFNELTPSILLAVGSIPVIMTVHNNQIVNAVSVLSERTGKECKIRICGGCVNCVGVMGMIYEKIKRPIHKQLLKKVSLFITPSQYMGNLVSEAGFKPVKVIPNGIKLLTYSKVKNYNTLLYVGRLTKDKGVEYLLRAMPEVIEKIPHVKLLLVGEGADKDYFKQLSENLKITKNVEFTGAAENNKIADFYIESTVVIIPSIYPDNFPTVCIEAMSAGRPVIGSNIGGIPELIEDGESGNLIYPKNAEKISNSILHLLSRKELIHFMSEKSYTKSKTFSIQYHTTQLNLTYSRILGT